MPAGGARQSLDVGLLDEQSAEVKALQTKKKPGRGNLSDSPSESESGANIPVTKSSGPVFVHVGAVKVVTEGRRNKGGCAVQ